MRIRIGKLYKLDPFLISNLDVSSDSVKIIGSGNGIVQFKDNRGRIFRTKLTVFLSHAQLHEEHVKTEEIEKKEKPKKEEKPEEKPQDQNDQQKEEDEKPQEDQQQKDSEPEDNQDDSPYNDDYFDNPYGGDYI